jgi:hypothetical protein
MQKTLPNYQYRRLLLMYTKLNLRLEKHFATGRFIHFTKAQQAKLIHRLERMKAQLLRWESALKLAGSALVFASVFYAGDVSAQFAPNGNEFMVNTHTTDLQVEARIASDSDGDFVVTWNSDYQDGDLEGIYAQRYNASGVAQGAEFKVNTTTSNDQRSPSIAMDSDGDFVIVWSSQAQDGDGRGIYAQRFNKSGVAQGSEFLVNTTTSNSQINPSVAMDSDGDFVITWESAYQSGGDYTDIYAQRYNAAGVAQGSEFLVNTTTTNYQESPSIAMDSNGDFVITWESYTYGQNNTDGYDVFAQRFNAAGVPQGIEFMVNTVTSSDQYRSSIAMDADGDFVIAWSSQSQDGASHGVYAQRYNASGQAQGTEFLVNTETSADQDYSSVAMDSDGDFVIAWTSYNQDGDGDGVYAQRYTANGVKQGVEFRVNTETSSTQKNSSVAMDSDGDFVIAWQSNSQRGSSFNVYAQRYAGGFVTSVQNAAVITSADLYPNPAQDQVFVNLEGEVNVKVLDASGALIKETVLTNQSFTVSDLKSGLYMIQLTQAGSSVMKKLVVQ